MQEDKNKVEAILFTTGRFIGLDEISKMTGIASVGYLKEVLFELVKDYKNKNCSLEITQQVDKWKLNIRKEYLHLTQSLLQEAEFDGATQETLAVIAYKNPALQSEIIKIRGNGAYDHIKLLKELDFIVSEPFGRSKIIKLTSKFFDYFDIVENQLKIKMDKVLEEKTENVNSENISSGEKTNEEDK